MLTNYSSYRKLILLSFSLPKETWSLTLISKSTLSILHGLAYVLNIPILVFASSHTSPELTSIIQLVSKYNHLSPDTLALWPGPWTVLGSSQHFMSPWHIWYGSISIYKILAVRQNSYLLLNWGGNRGSSVCHLTVDRQIWVVSSLGLLQIKLLEHLCTNLCADRTAEMLLTSCFDTIFTFIYSNQ